MHWKLCREDLRQDPATHFIVFFFMAMAGLLLALALHVSVQLYGAVGHFMDQGQTPHFVQMHRGDIDNQALAAFAQSQEGIEDFEVISFLNIPSGELWWEGEAFADPSQDHGFVQQAKRMDYLLDGEGRVIDVAPGQTYLPLMYQNKIFLRAGLPCDSIYICKSLLCKN